MDGSGTGQCSNGGERRIQIVSGKRFGGGLYNQIYSAQPSSPKVQQIPATVTVTNRVGSSVSNPWGFGDPEVKRKKRVAMYKVYTVEGKVKASLRKGIRWIKIKCSQIIHGY